LTPLTNAASEADILNGMLLSIADPLEQSGFTSNRPTHYEDAEERVPGSQLHGQLILGTPSGD